MLQYKVCSTIAWYDTPPCAPEYCSGRPVTFALRPADPAFGSALEIDVSQDAVAETTIHVRATESVRRVRAHTRSH
jgi:hypothetical protein